MSSYLHFRPGYTPDYKLLSELGDKYQESIDIFHPISRDEPQGVWSIQKALGETVTVIRSLLWPGYIFYHRPQDNAVSLWGSIYVGQGQRNDNLGFML